MPDSSDAMGIYQALNNVLLEGMPCDYVNEILEQSAQHVLWQQTVDLHLSFWEEVAEGLKTIIYYEVPLF